MSESLNSLVTTIDGLIEWLNDHRKKDTETPLVTLIGSHVLDRSVILVLACIDLMYQRRNGRSVRIEQYLTDFPQLSHANAILDLIDAELCVATELQEPTELEVYRQRFPELSSEIEELTRLDLMPEMPFFHRESSSATENFWLDDLALADRERVTVDSTDDLSTGFSVDLAALSSGQAIPLSKSVEKYLFYIPAWFVVDQCVARSEGCWLLRGRDDVRGIPLAMKITCLPCWLTDIQVNDLLDVCEAASNVQNSHWVAPRMVAVQKGYLGVIRPWQFGHPWKPEEGRRSSETSQAEDQNVAIEPVRSSGNADRSEPNEATRSRHLAEVAFAVQAAHRSGATHGALHAGNLVIDHTGQVRILDAASSMAALTRWLENEPTTFHDLDQRVQIDVDDMVRLVCDVAQRKQSSQTASLVNQVRQGVANHRDAPLAVVGEILMRYADREEPTDTSVVDHGPP